MRIGFLKLCDERHVLEIVHDDGRRESVASETRSYLLHDLLHLAVESEARLECGFWGLLAKGKTLAEMNDRTGQAMAAQAPALMRIEQVVGALSGLPRGLSPADAFRALQSYAAAQETTTPPWLTEALVDAVRERMRRLLGQWKATPNGGVMKLRWPG